MKNSFLILTFSILLSVFLIGCSDSGNNVSSGESINNEDTSEVIEMNVNNWLPSTHSYATKVYEPWAEIVNEKTNGRVKVNVVSGGALGEAKSTYQDVKGGLYDVGLVTATYYPETNFFPYIIGTLPYALPGGAESTKKILEPFGEKYAKDLDDVIVMGATASDHYVIFSTKPIHSAKDVNGLKVRVTGKADVEFVKALGGSPVSIKSEQLYESLDKGTVDMTFYAITGVLGGKHYEAAPYVTMPGAFTPTILPIMNKEFYGKLPDDLKKLFDEELNPKLVELFVADASGTSLENATKTLEEEIAKRGEIFTLSEEEQALFKKAGKAGWDQWIADANNLGYPGEEMVEYYIELLKKEGYPSPF